MPEKVFMGVSNLDPRKKISMWGALFQKNQARA